MTFKYFTEYYKDQTTKEKYHLMNYWQWLQEKGLEDYKTPLPNDYKPLKIQINKGEFNVRD